MRVICAGEMLVDIFVRPVQQIPFENDTQIVPDIRITSGGDANNNAINFAKLGHQVAYLGRLGCDEMGDYVASLAQAAGIDISHTVRSSTARQTKSVILVNPKGDRTFLQDPGTSAEFCFDDCDLSLLDWAEMLQIGGAFHLPKFDGEGSAQLLKAAKERGVITSMDVTSDRSGRWKGILDPCWPYLDYFLPSIEQASPDCRDRGSSGYCRFLPGPRRQKRGCKTRQPRFLFQKSSNRLFCGHLPGPFHSGNHRGGRRLLRRLFDRRRREPAPRGLYNSWKRLFRFGNPGGWCNGRHGQSGDSE